MKIDSAPIDTDTFEALRDLFGEEFEALLCGYLVNAPELAAQIAAAVQAQNTAEVAAAAHQLKATSATFGALPLTEIAEQIESQASAGNLRGCRTLVDSCLDEADRVSRALKSACPVPGC